MCKSTTLTIQSRTYDFPDILAEIPDAPARLHLRTSNWPDLLARPWVAIVGSRKVTTYGRSVTSQLARELAHAGVVIVSGLALGVDTVAHRAVLETGGLTVAVLAGGFDHIHPRSHSQIAERITAQGGALVSEYSDATPCYKQHFIARNRIVSGLSRAVVITEAAQKSGTLHTARFALEQGRDVFAVPGNITSATSVGTNNLIRCGAIPVTSSSDILQHLGITPTHKQVVQATSSEEKLLLDLLAAGTADGAALLAASGLSPSQFNQTLTMLEISGAVRGLGNNQWAVL